jgi:hypothetical protein
MSAKLSIRTFIISFSGYPVLSQIIFALLLTSKIYLRLLLLPNGKRFMTVFITQNNKMLNARKLRA